MEPEVYLLVTQKYASLLELDKDYSVSDAYDLLEMIDVKSSLEEARHKDEERKQPRGR